MIRGRDLRAARQATRVSLGKLAQRIGRDKGHLSRVERELDAREVTPALVRDYERVLGITIIPADNAARDLGLNSIEPSDSGAAGIAPSSLPSQYAGDGVLLHLRVNDREVIVPLSRRTVLAGGLGSMLDVFSVDLGADEVAALTDPTKARRLTITSQAHLDEVLVHLRDQWHALVKTDNLLGPRFAIMGVRHQIAIIDSILSDLHHSVRKDVVRLGAEYAESAAWLYQDVGDTARAHHWTDRAMEWAYEGDDRAMLAWVTYRRSQQASLGHHAAQAIGLAQAARRDEEQLPAPMRAAIRVQEAQGHALAGDESAAQHLLDEAHAWAGLDVTGDARGGHGSFCTPSYIEMHRADVWLTVGRPTEAVRHYEQTLPTVPSVYQRDRAAGLSRLATAYAVNGRPEEAASTARAALPVARSAGSSRILNEIRKVGATLEPHGGLAPVAQLFNEIRDVADG